MAIQFNKWLEILGHCGGCVITDVLKRRDIFSSHVSHFLASSDAATDSVPAGLGGYMHGLYWNFQIPVEDLRWLHITVLELLACAFNALIFTCTLPHNSRLTLMVDDTAAYFTLAEETERSPLLMHTHHLILSEDRFRVWRLPCAILCRRRATLMLQGTLLVDPSGMCCMRWPLQCASVHSVWRCPVSAVDYFSKCSRSLCSEMWRSAMASRPRSEHSVCRHHSPVSD